MGWAIKFAWQLCEIRQRTSFGLGVNAAASRRKAANEVVIRPGIQSVCMAAANTYIIIP
jgi:hypothetical protein